MYILKYFVKLHRILGKSNRKLKVRDQQQKTDKNNIKVK